MTQLIKKYIIKNYLEKKFKIKSFSTLQKAILNFLFNIFVRLHFLFIKWYKKAKPTLSSISVKNKHLIKIDWTRMPKSKSFPSGPSHELTGIVVQTKYSFCWWICWVHSFPPLLPVKMNDSLKTLGTSLMLRVHGRVGKADSSSWGIWFSCCTLMNKRPICSITTVAMVRSESRALKCRNRQNDSCKCCID